MKFFYTYVLKSRKDGRYYTGSTNDLKRRLEEHNSGQVESTKYRKPLDLVYFEARLNEHTSRLREQYLKSTWGKRYLKSQIDPS